MSHWVPSLPAAGGFFGVALIIFAAHKPMPWEQQRKRDLRKQRRKSRDRWQM